MNAALLAGAALAAVTAGIHLIAGHVDPVRPLLACNLAETPKRTMHAVWHMVTADLVLTAAAMSYLGIVAPDGTRLAALLIAGRFLCYAVVFIVITLSVRWPRPLLRLPQWMLLLPIAASAAAGAW